MVAPTAWNVTPQSGVDITTYYAGISASTTPETPAPPYVPGEMVQGNLGSEFVFVQASTSIALGDFVAIQNGFMTNSLTSTNVVSSLGCQVGIAGTVVAQSLTYIPAGAYYWAAIRGSSLAGNAASAVTSTAVQLFTSATAGAITSVSTSMSLAAALMGIECVSSTTPLFKLTWPRTAIIFANTLAQTQSLVSEA